MTAVTTSFDNPAWSALTGHHAGLADRVGAAARYRADVCPFGAVEDPADPSNWADLHRLVGPGSTATLIGVDTPPVGWTVEWSLPGVRMVAETLDPVDDPEAVVLGEADTEEILALVAATRPGPFLARTVTMGRYLGLRHGGRLVAMAGERLHPAGGTEISAVCTDPAFRGRGFAARLVRAVAAGVVARGETPLLHAAASNEAAIALYRTLGFGPPSPVAFTTLRAPGHPLPEENTA